MVLTNIKIIYLTTSCDDLYLTSRHNDLTSRRNYLTSDGRNMLPYIKNHADMFRKRYHWHILNSSDVLLRVLSCNFVANKIV